MRILLLNWRDPRNPKAGGAEIVTLEHAKAWINKGNSVLWLTSGFKGGKRQENIQGVKIVRWGNYITIYLLAPLYYLINRSKFDFVVDEIHGFPFFTPLFVKKPILVIIHEVADEIWDYMYPWPVNFIGKLSEKFYFNIYRKMNFLVPSQSTLKDLISKGIPNKNITLFFCGANLQPLKKNRKEKKPTFIFVSRLVKMKGLQRVIEAFSYIKKEAPDSQLWIVGDGLRTDVMEFKKMVNDMNLNRSVTFFGKVNEDKKFNLLRRAHILLHASVKEGWGLVVIEAASQKTPSVVYDVAGLRDSVVNKITGIVIHINSPKKLAEEALALINNKMLYKKYQDNAYVNTKKFTWKNSTKVSINLMNKIYKDYV